MTADNLNIVLTNSLCCISAQAVRVSKLYSIGDKCADSELQKLKLMNDWFEALRCYNIDAINSKFSIRTDGSNDSNFYNKISESIATYSVIVNDVSYPFVGDNVTLVKVLLANTLNTITNIVSYDLIFSPDGGRYTFTYLYIEADCDVDTIILQTIKNDNTSQLPLTQYIQGICTPTNCLSEEDFNILVAKLMKECDICECQLNQ